MGNKVRIGVFGGRRGTSLMNVLSHHPDADVVAICEQDPRAAESCRQAAERLHINVTFYDDFEHFIEHDMDAVVLANYATEHAPYAIRALDSGRHVLSELLPCQTLAEAVRLAEAVERSNAIYAYAENCCFLPSVLEMRRIYRRGDIGDFLYGEGQYIHDCEPIWDQLTQGRHDHWRNWIASTFYITHSNGPLMWVTGTRPVRLTAYETPRVNKQRYGCRSGDIATVVCQMNNGAVTVTMPWGPMKREPAMQWYSIFGSRGMMETDRWSEATARLHVYVDGEPDQPRSFVPDPPADLAFGEMEKFHGGGDIITMHHFLQAILDRPGKELAIDIYEALDMSLPGLLGYRSIWEGNVPIDVPDFRDKAVRENYRNDNWSPDPKLAGPGQPTSSCSWDKGEGEA